ncbi:MAG: protein kinase domain-containing protein [Thermoguttaceae bacterium]
MSWPLASHFSTMLQNPRIAFRDPRLQRAVIEKNEQNQPRPWAGAFAVVYKGVDPDGQAPVAIRIFTTESPERRERYDLISAYLKGRKLNCLVDFEYRDRSIRSAGDGKWYPLIVMDWVQGDTLFNWLRARCMECNRDAIATVADRWLEAVQELSDNSLAHGDLQHANVMVDSAWQLKLVDYDGMCVPPLVGRRNLEVGVEPYQHRDRGAGTLLSLDLDNFSALLIYVALRALAIQPALWAKYVEQVGYDKLLFRREDFQAPAQSPLYYDLMQLGNNDLRSLTERLFALSQARMEDVPPLGQLANSYAEVERLLAGRQWEAAVELLNRRGHFRDAPAALRPLIYQAYEQVCRQQAWTKFLRIPVEATEQADRQLVEAWNESLFANYPPAEQQRQRIADARQRVQLLDRLRHLIQRSAGTISLSGEKGLAVTAANFPRGYRYSLQDRVELARRRVTAFGRLETALNENTSETAILAAWKAVVAANCAQFVSIDWGMRIAVAEERLPVFKALAKITSDLPPDQRDQRILAVWKEKLMADCSEADKWRPLYQMAAVRREVLKRLQASVDARDDAGMVQWGSKRCLAKYPLPQPLAEAIAAARERLGRSESLLTALGNAAEGNGENQMADNSTTCLPAADHASMVPAREGMPLFEHGTMAPAPHEDLPSSEPALEPPAPPPGFSEQFDSRAVRAQAERFAPFQAILQQWLRSEVLPLEKLGLALAAEQPALSPVEEPEGHLRATWKWPEMRLSEQCILAVCATEPKAGDDPEQIAAHWRECINAAQWAAEGPGWLIPVDKGWEGSSVAVWAVIDLGFQKLFSPPLVLGQIESRSRWKWPRLFSRRSEPEDPT